MKHDWEYKKIKDITSLFTDGDWIESKDQSESGIRLIQTGNIGDGFYIGKEDRPHFISEETFERLKCTEIFEGDCLISRLPQPLGRSCLLPKLDCRAITAVDCSILRFKNICNPYYFVYYTQSFKYQNTVDINATGTTRKRISRKNLENIPIPLPPLSTQQSIVSELDSLSKIIADCKETLKDYDALEQSIFYDMFGDPVKNDKGWEVKELKSLCREIGDGLHGTPEYLDNSNLYFVNGNNLNDGFIEIKENTKSVTENAYEQYYIELDEKTLLISINGTLGKVAFYRNEKIILGKSACYLKVGNDIDIIYLYRLLSSHYFRNYMESECTGTTIRNVSLKTMRNYNCPLPPLALQQTFASKIEAIEQMKVETKKALQEAETLFQARMDYWFN